MNEREREREKDGQQELTKNNRYLNLIKRLVRKHSFWL